MTLWLLLFLSLAAAGQQSDLRVGPLSVQPGSMKSGVLPAGAAADPGADIPVTVVNGTKPGPILALVAGNHGYEYPPILALQRLRRGFQPSRITGSVILVHAANMPSFLARTIYFSPLDGKNLNRVYPGKRDGTVSERIAYAITAEVIEKCDYLLDLHCGDGNESLRPYLYQAVTGDARMDQRIAGMAQAFGMDHIVVERGRPSDPAHSVYCSTTAITRGKPALTVESGFLGSTDEESTVRIERGVLNVMRHLKMLSGEPESVREPVYLDPAVVLDSPATGILYPHVERGHTVAKGALLAHVTNFFGERIGEVRSPFDGEVLYIVATPPITKGQPVAFVGARAAAPVR